ncbi:MAG TPA: glycosyltransferase [Terracidiphilus sp.]|nr:glycosyltransferase [Terracidiphilus sp.]
MAKRSTLLLLIPHLGGGGAERVIELLARNLPQELYALHLGLITQVKVGTIQLPSHVAVHALGAHRARYAVVPLFRLIRQVQPDLILSGMVHANFLLLSLRPFLSRRARILVRQSGTASEMLQSHALPRWASTAYRRLYCRADGIICQSQAMADDLVRCAGVSHELLHVLPNPVDIHPTRLDCNGTRFWHGPGPHLFAAGRLSREKGFDLLLHAFARVRALWRTADLAIAGTGREEEALRQLCGSLGLKDSVHFLGHVDAPAEYYFGASLFVLPSRQEGIPNALLEAAAGGLPIVATPASVGLVKLVGAQPGIWLADGVSAEALTKALMAAFAQRPGERFCHRWVEPFALKNAIPAWVQLIDSTLEKAPLCLA